MDTKQKRSPRFRGCVLAVLLCVACYCSSSASPWSSSPWSSSLVSGTAGSNGGSSPGSPPSPPFSSMSAMMPPVQDSPACAGLRGDVRKHRTRTFNNKPSADSLLAIMQDRWADMMQVCPPRYQLWHYQPLIGSMIDAERFDEAAQTFEAANLPARYKAHWRRYGGMLTGKYAYALYQLKRYTKAAPFFTASDSLYLLRDDQDQVAQSRAKMLVNGAWNAFRRGDFVLARRRRAEAVRILGAACCTATVVWWIRDADSLLGLMPGKGLERPDTQRTEIRQEEPGAWRIAGAVALVVAFVVGVGLWRRRTKLGLHAPEHSAEWKQATNH